MISQQQATASVEAYLKHISASSGLELVMLEKETIEKSFGWICFYTSRRYLQTGDIGDALAGNGPILVDRRDGSLHVTGTAYPAEFYIENYETHGSPYGKEEGGAGIVHPSAGDPSQKGASKRGQVRFR